MSTFEFLDTSWEKKVLSNPEASLNARILSGDRELSQAQLLENVARAATGLSRLGVGSEDTVAMMLRNDLPFFEVSMAANLLGAHAVPINWHFQAEEAGYILRDSKARVMVVHADLLPQIKTGIPKGVHTFVVATPPEVQAAYGIAEQQSLPPRDLPDWSDWVESHEPRQLAATPPPSSMIYTSGTTGNPKGVRREPYTEKSAAKFTEMVSLVFGLKPDGLFRTVITGPMYHSAPNAYGLWAAKNGGFCVLQPRFDAEDLQLIERHRITHLHMVPTMFARLLKLSDDIKHKYDLSSLEFVVHAAAPCPPEVKHQMIQWWGPVINEYYGATETGCVVFHTSEEALRKPGTVGRPIKGGVVRIYDEEGNELGPNQTGEVYLWVEGFPDFTYNALDQQRREIGRDGLVTVGDVGYVDEDGYLFLCDRSRDMVISGGVNIYPAEIEAAIIGMPGVHDCAVFGIPDEEYGESLCACIQPEVEAPLTADLVREFLSQKLAHYKVPKLIEFRSDLPREDSGKIFKRKLRAPYWEQTGRQI
ncbi:MAG TPA: acyl-CoA synthetase [Blastocatellia bacterium]|nr:acyl-CoA synthetase [Blastocatellia bacterium]